MCNTAIQLDFKPQVYTISRTSRFVHEFYDAMLADPDATSRVALTTHELLENSAKYSYDGVGHLRVEVEDRGGHSLIRVQSRNRAVPEQLAELRRFLDEIRSAPDPLSLYYDFIARSAERQDRSGLGLARICAEGEMELSYQIEGDEVTVSAEAAIQLKATNTKAQS